MSLAIRAASMSSVPDPHMGSASAEYKGSEGHVMVSVGAVVSVSVMPVLAQQAEGWVPFSNHSQNELMLCIQ